MEPTITDKKRIMKIALINFKASLLQHEMEYSCWVYISQTTHVSENLIYEYLSSHYATCLMINFLFVQST